VVLRRQFSNPAPPPLRRALKAYHHLNLADTHPLSPPRHHTKRAVHLSPAQLDALLSLYREGANQQDLAMKFDINRLTVMEHVKRARIRPRWRILTPEDMIHAINLYQAGQSLEQVGDQLGVNAETIRLTLRRHGTPIRPRRGWKY